MDENPPRSAARRATPRRLLISLTPDDYRRLAEFAGRELRDPEQHANWLLRQALALSAEKVPA